jgi:hypothetical protein
MTPLSEMEVGRASLERFRTVLTQEHRGGSCVPPRGPAAPSRKGDLECQPGGGVAEVFGVPYSRGAGVDVRRVVIDGRRGTSSA